MQSMELSVLIFYGVIVLLVLDYAFDRWLEAINIRQWNKPLPKGVASMYDKESYAKAKAYALANYRMSLISSSISTLFIVLFLLFNGLSILDHWVYAVLGFDKPIIAALLFFGVIAVVLALINLPFSFYSTFVIEQKFGFNKTSLKTFLLDLLKSSLLSLILGAGILSLIVKLYLVFGANFWLFAWLVMAIIMLLVSMFYSNIIVPLFNKQQALEAGELRTAIDEFAKKVGFKLDNIYVIDGSKRSTKANAYFTGLGPKKRIVLYDTLIQEHSTEELVAILAHEIGHYKHKHTRISLVLSLLQSAIMLYLLSLFIAPGGVVAEATARAFDVLPSFQIGVLIFGILYSPISQLVGILMNVFSRRNEYQADAFAAKNASAVDLSQALIKLSKNNLSNLNPHPYYVFVNYSHPPLLFRLNALRRLKETDLE